MTTYNFYIRKGNDTLADGTYADKAAYLAGLKPIASYGPFRKRGASGDVKVGDDIYIDFYDNVQGGNR